MEAYITLVMTGRWLDIMYTYRFIYIYIYLKIVLISTISPIVFLCSEEELPYHNAAMEWVKVSSVFILLPRNYIPQRGRKVATFVIEGAFNTCQCCCQAIKFDLLNITVRK